jgi:hypothetical protein
LQDQTQICLVLCYQQSGVTLFVHC